MAVPERTGGGSAYTLDSGIPTGLNRIRTRRANVDPGADDSDQFNESPSSRFSISGTHVTQKLKALRKRHVKLGRSKEGFRKGRTLAQWFGSSVLKDSHQALGDFPATDTTALELNKPEKDDCRKKSYKMQKNLSVDSPKVNTSNKARKTLKSFSNELGLRAGHQSAFPRARSYKNLKLLGSLRSRFDTAKEVVNIELGSFSYEVLDVLEKVGSLAPDEYKIAEYLYVLARQCIDMTSLEFRTNCETVVQDLTTKRQTCQAESLKLLFTRILFIVTRCTRLLHFEKDSDPMSEHSLDKFRACLERIPSVDMNWVVNKGFADSDMGYELKQNDLAMQKLLGEDHSVFPSLGIDSGYNEPTNKEETDFLNAPFLFEQQRLENASTNCICDEKNHVIHDIFRMESINMEKENSIDNFDSVICRICEEPVPAMNLEQHSYICAFADKCVSKNLDVNGRLLNAAQLLEHFVELHNSSNHETFGNPEILRVPALNSALKAEGYSPKCSDWRGKVMDGMLDDLHEMDTACIEESHVSNLVNLKNHWLTKVNQYGSPSSNGSVTSTSSSCSPRAGIFDNIWSDLYLSELESMQQIHDLVDIAHCVAATDLSGEESREFLLACMHDLQAVLQQSKHKALLVDTFGGRIESLLREKYILACNQVDRTDDIKHPESARSFLDSASQSSTTSTPSHNAYKERITIDDFDIIKPVSRGAYGKVFLARKRTTGDLFAIKVLKKLDMLRKNDIDRILAERNILITVRNPFVVRFFYSFTSKENLYLAMEYLNGGDLYSLLSKVGCLEEAIARVYIAELVLALEYLHSLGIVHRDLKPDNILIAHDGHIKLTDFGLSKIGLMNCTTELSMQEKKKYSFVDSHGLPNTEAADSHLSAVGTPDYLAPEILLGTEHGYAADWWSVGIILFELLTGIPPFNSDHPENIFDNILNRKIPWPSVPCEMSYGAWDLIDRFLVHEPDHRLGAKGAAEVKSHSFFSGLDWDNLTLQKCFYLLKLLELNTSNDAMHIGSQRKRPLCIITRAAFVPQPEGIDDTSYFVSRYNSTGMEVDQISVDSDSCSSEFHTNSRAEKMDECGDLSEFDSSPLDLSSINFSFKNLSQLASINQDVLLQNEKESSKFSSPCTISNTDGA